jgi:hypothetical protein
MCRHFAREQQSSIQTIHIEMFGNHTPQSIDPFLTDEY